VIGLFVFCYFAQAPWRLPLGKSNVPAPDTAKGTLMQETQTKHIHCNQKQTALRGAVTWRISRKTVWQKQNIFNVIKNKQPCQEQSRGASLARLSEKRNKTYSM
jgi:hypothetical protein